MVGRVRRNWLVPSEEVAVDCPDVEIVKVQEHFNGDVLGSPFVDAANPTVLIDQAHGGDRPYYLDSNGDIVAVAGEPGRSKDLRAVTHQMRLPVSTAGDWSVSFRIANPQGGSLVVNDVDGDAIAISAAGVISIDAVSVSSAVGDGNWHHVMITRNATSGDTTIYIDGYLRASGATANIGFNNPTFAGGAGQIHDVSIWSSILTVQDARKLYRGVHELHQSANTNLGVATPANLIGWWLCEDAGFLSVSANYSDATGSTDGELSPTGWSELHAINNGDNDSFSISNNYAVEVED